MLNNYERAIFDVVSEECEAMIPKNFEEHIFSAKFEKNMEKLIKRRSKPYYKLISTGARRAACMIVAVIVLSASALSVKAVREAVYEFIMRIFSDHTQISANREGPDEYPKTIEDEYYIADLPEGFELVDHDVNDYYVYSCFVKEDDYIVLRQFTKDKYVRNLDNERFEQNIIEVNGQKYITIYNNNEYTFIWDNGKYILNLTSNCDKESIINLCRSTKIKE